MTTKNPSLSTSTRTTPQWLSSLLISGVAAPLFGVVALGCEASPDAESTNESSPVAAAGNIRQAEQPSTRANYYSQVSAGAEVTCGIRSNQAIECWGHRLPGDWRPPTGHFSEITSGPHHFCALNEDSEIECWGGRSGAGAPSGQFRDIASGAMHNCAIRESDDRVECWGRNDEGQLDAPDVAFKKVSPGQAHTCGITAADALKCWGDVPEFVDLNVGPVADLASGALCVITKDDGEVHCYGPTFAHPNLQSPEFSHAPYTSVVATQGGRVCAIGRYDRIDCFDLGRETIGYPLESYRSITLGSDHICAVLTSGEATCWGDDSYGQLEIPTGVSTNSGRSNAPRSFLFYASRTDSGKSNTTNKKFMLKAGDTLQASTCETSGKGDTYLRLFDPAGTEVERNDDACLGLRSRLSFAVPESGVYELRAGCFGSSSCEGWVEVDKVDKVAPVVVEAPPAAPSCGPNAGQDAGIGCREGFSDAYQSALRTCGPCGVIQSSGGSSCAAFTCGR